MITEQPIQQVFRYELRPSTGQLQALASHAGGARYAFNWGISKVKEALVARRAEQDEKIAKHLAEHPDDDPDELRKTIKGDTPVPGHFDLCKQWTAFKNAHADTPEAERAQGVPYTGWVGQNSSSTYQSALRNAHVAWSNRINSATGRRAGRRVGAPRYKSRHRSRPSFTVNGSVALPQAQRIQKPSRNQVSAYRQVHLPTIGVIPTKESTKKLARLMRRGDVDCSPCTGRGHLADAPDCKPCEGAGVRADGKRCRTCKGHGRAKCPTCLGEGRTPYCRIVSATCSQDPDGRWYVAIVVARLRAIPAAPNRRQRAGGPVGLDIGVSGFTASTGAVIEVPRPLQEGLVQLQRLARDLARAERGSRRRERARLRLAKAHGRIANIRRDYNSQLATRLIRGHDRIAVEGWSIADVVAAEDKNLPARLRSRRRRELLDIGAGQLRQMLTTRAPWYGVQASFTSDYQATARTCSACGAVRTKPVPLAQPMFDCDSCGKRIDRRRNSAIVTLILSGAEGGSDP